MPPVACCVHDLRDFIVYCDHRSALNESNKMPLISVILPARNAGGFVKRAVSSTLRALPRDAELVLVDDGSTDDTLDVAQQIQDARLRVVRHVSSVGLAASLNEAIELTDSEFVARMDADDVCLPWRFALQIKQLRDHSLDAAFGAVLYMRSNGLVTRPDAPGHLDGPAVGLSLVLGNSLVHPTLFVRRSTLVRVGQYRDVRAEDYELWMRMVNAGARIARSAVPMILYRKHSGQISSSPRWREALANEAARGPIPDGHRLLFERYLGSSPWRPEYLHASLRLSASAPSLELAGPMQRAIKEAGLSVTERVYLAGRLKAFRAFCLSAQ